MPCASCYGNYSYYCSGGYCNSCCTNNLQSCCGPSGTTINTPCITETITCPSGTLACVDVAEFCTSTTTVDIDPCCGHTINITNKTRITLSQFKKMFFADGEYLSVAEPPCCTDDIDSIIESPWGIYDGPSHTCLADFSSTYSGTIEVPQNANLTYYYTRSDRYRDWIYVLTDTSGGTWIPKSFLQPNTNTAIMNYNRLGGRDFDPSGAFLGYMFSDISNVMQTFYAQKTIMSNMELDICTSRKKWTLCSRSSVFDQLYNLAFASTDFNNSCLKLCCGRSWTELIDALREYSHFSYLLTGNNIISFDYLPADPSSNRFPENLFSILGANITRIQNYPITVPPTYDASYNGTIWTYNSTNLGNNQWEVLTNTNYQITVSINTPFFFNLIVPGTDITLYINVKICNAHCNILSNKIRIAYVCRVDKSLYNYCGSGHREEIQYASAAAAAAAQASARIAPTISILGTTREDETLTTTFSAGGGGIKGTETYQWKNTTGTIAGATSSSYTLRQSDVAKTLTVVVSWTNQSNQAINLTSSVTTTVLNVNDPPVGSVTISGSVNKGDTLTVTNNLTDEDGMPLVVTYEWIRNGAYGSPISSGNTSNNTYVLVAGDVGTTINVVVKYEDALGNQHTVTSATTSTIKIGTTVTITGTATEDQTLTAIFEKGSAQVRLFEWYQWKRNNDVISGATTNTYNLVQADVGKTITVAAVWNDNEFNLHNVTSAPTSVVINVNDPPVGSVTISGSVNKGDTLTVTNNLTDEDGMPLVVTYEWIRNGAYGSPISSGNTSNNTYVLVENDVGTTINVVVKYEDALGNQHTVTSATTSTITNITTVRITGTATEGQTLTAIFNAGTITFARQWYEWKRNNDFIGATTNTYNLVQADVGKTITVMAIWEDDVGNNGHVTSTPTSVVTNVNDTPTGSISIDGITWVGQVLTANLTALVDEDGLPGTFQYKWLRDGTHISGTTQSTYTLQGEDEGYPISVNITYDDILGQNESVTSTQTANITNPPASTHGWAGFSVSPAIDSKTSWIFKNDGEFIIPSDGTQYTLIPNMDFTIRVIMWGGGGGEAHYSTGVNGIGAAGGYTDGIITFESGKTYYAFAATHGGTASSDALGGEGGLPGGGNGYKGGTWHFSGHSGAGGGGYSGIFLTTHDQSGTLLIAGGGGGATGYGFAGNDPPDLGHAGEGGGLNGGKGYHATSGGTQTAGGDGKTPGSALQGGGAATTSIPGESSGGGGGYFGGGSGFMIETTENGYSGSGGSGFISSKVSDGMTIRGYNQYAPGSPSLPNNTASGATRADSFDTVAGYGAEIDGNRGIWDLKGVYDFYNLKLNDTANAIAQGGREGNVSQDAADGMLILKKPNSTAYLYYRLYFVYNDVKSNGANLMDTSFGSTTNYIRFVREGDNKLLPFDETGGVMNVASEGTVTSHPTNYTHSEAGNKQGNYTYSLHQIFKQELTSQTIWASTWGSGGKAPGRDANPPYTWIQYKFNTPEIINGVWFGSQRPSFSTKYSFHNISLLATNDPAIGEKGPDEPVVLSEWEPIIPYTQITWDNQGNSVGEKKLFVAGELQRGITSS